MINGISLFANVGIAETYFKENDINIAVANELLPKRCKIYKHLYPTCNLICGDISDKTIFNKLITLYKENNCKFLIATPPCQGMSQAGKMNPDDPRNTLIIHTINFIKETRPQNIIIENVPQILKFSIKINGIQKKIVDYITEELSPLGYHINYDILDASDYNTPQTRKRAIFLISSIAKWDFPPKQLKITVKQAIGNLPPIESGEKSDIPRHYAKKHTDRHIEWMKNTPTGQTAFDNKTHYPQKDGRKIKGYRTTYKRMEWDKPAPTITMCNGAISSQNNVHPGRKLKDGTYSDARVLSPLELLRLTGLPDNWDYPKDISDNQLRQVIGEGFPPKFAQALLTTMPHSDNYE